MFSALLHLVRLALAPVYVTCIVLWFVIGQFSHSVLQTFAPFDGKIMLPIDFFISGLNHTKLFYCDDLVVVF